MASTTGRHVHPRASEAGDAAHRAGRSAWVDKLARMGLAARGVVYVMVGYFALQIAFGHSNRNASRQGAFHAIASKSWGPALLWLMAIGFVGYAIWRLTEAIWGHADEDSTAKRLAKRAFSLGRCVLYAFFGYSAASLAAGSNSSGGGGGGAKSLSARLMKEPFGRPLLAAIGAGLIIGGAIFAYRGLKTKFEKKLKTDQMSQRTRSIVEKVGMAGMVARGAVFALIGIFLVQAAVTFQPKKAKGLDASLHTLAGSGWGKFLLVLVALGLIAFGIYSFFEARYRRTGNEGGADGSSGAAHDPYGSGRSVADRLTERATGGGTAARPHP